jgi:hypothetical protein
LEGTVPEIRNLISRLPDDLPVRASLAIGALAYAFASLLGLGLAWDGSYFLFHSLDTGQPLVPYNRFIHWPLQEPAILARSMTESPRALAAIFSFTYLLIPLASLVASWWVVRKRRPRLFVWSVIGIGLVSLPGQAFMVSEAIMSVQLAWPILLAFLTGRPGEHRFVVVAFSLALVLGHPFAVPILGCIAVAAVLLAMAERSQRRSLMFWAVIIGALSVAALLRSIAVEFDTTHVQAFSADQLTWAFGEVILGPPLVMLVLAYLGSAALVVGTLLRRRGAPDRARGAELMAFALLTVAGVVLLPWAADPHAWWKGLDYRLFVLVFAAPVMAMAFLDALLGRREDDHASVAEMGAAAVGAVGDDDAAGAPGTRARLQAEAVLTRHWIAASQAVVILVVLGAFSISFLNLQNQLVLQVGRDPATCQTIWWRDWVRHTPLDHWASTADSLVVQGRTPMKVALPACYVDASAGFPLTDWQIQGYTGGWFNLTDLGANLQPRPAAQLGVVVVKSFAAGSAHSVTVTALDASGAVAAGYRGTIHFTSSDPAADLPADYTFTEADKGVHYFFYEVRLKTAGLQSVSATDVATSIAGSQTAISVGSGVATTFALSVSPDPYRIRAPATVKVVALDAYGNVSAGYRGTVHFTSSDPTARLPADYTFTANDRGAHEFVSELALEGPGSQSVTAVDTANSSIEGSWAGPVG